MTNHVRATGAVVDFIDRARWNDFPAEAVAIAKRCIIDGLGVMLAGSTQDAGRILRDYVRGSDARADSTVFGPQAFRTGAASAALLNGTSGHALDWDDTQLATSADRIFGLLTHPTIPPLAVALAIGERQRVSGKVFLEAFLTGFEVECKISEAIHPNHYKKGFHSSGTVGTFGAMAAAAKLLGLDAGAIEHALAIAASMASGIRVNFGSMTKPLHVGRASQNGVVAAELAAMGFTGGRQGLDPPWGFFQVLSHGDGFDADRIVGKLGNPHTIVWPGVSIKPYPCGVLGHPTMDAMRRLVITHDVKPEQITAIRVRAGSNILNPLRYRDCAQRARGEVLSGVHGERHRAAAQGGHPRVQRRVRAERAGAADDGEGGARARSGDRGQGLGEDPEHGRSRSRLDGRTLVEHADERYRGGPDLPFTREELCEKFSDCASLVLPESAVDETFGMVESLDSVSDISDLVRVLHRRRTIDGRRRPMNLAWISVGALVLAVTLSCTTTINVGILSMAMALIVGVFLGGMTSNAVLEGFPTELLVTLIGVTLLFAIAECNGTLARLTARAVRLCRGHAGVLPIMFFVIGFIIATIGAGATPASALLAPPAMAVAGRAGVPPLLMAIMTGNGALAGTLSPFAPTGIVAHGVMERIGLGGVEWQTFAYNALAHTIVGFGGFLLLGGWKLFRPTDGRKPRAASGRSRRGPDGSEALADDSRYRGAHRDGCRARPERRNDGGHHCDRARAAVHGRRGQGRRRLVHRGRGARQRRAQAVQRTAHLGAVDGDRRSRALLAAIRMTSHHESRSTNHT